LSYKDAHFGLSVYEGADLGLLVVSVRSAVFIERTKNIRRHKHVKSFGREVGSRGKFLAPILSCIGAL